MRRRIGQTQERRRIWWRPSKCRSFMWLCLYSHGPRKKIKRTHKYDFYFEFHSFQGTQWWPPGTPWTRLGLRRCQELFRQEPDEDWEASNLLSYFKDLLYLTGVFTSCVNPIIYGLYFHSGQRDWTGQRLNNISRDAETTNTMMPLERMRELM